MLFLPEIFYSLIFLHEVITLYADLLKCHFVYGTDYSSYA